MTPCAPIHGHSVHFCDMILCTVSFHKRISKSGKSLHGVMSHMWMSRVAWENKSRRAHDESCCTYGWVVSHIWMSRVAHMDESCRTYGWVVSHIKEEYVKWRNVSWYCPRDAYSFITDSKLNSNPNPTLYTITHTHTWINSKPYTQKQNHEPWTLNTDP